MTKKSLLGYSFVVIIVVVIVFFLLSQAYRGIKISSDIYGVIVKVENVISLKRLESLMKLDEKSVWDNDSKTFTLLKGKSIEYILTDKQLANEMGLPTGDKYFYDISIEKNVIKIYVKLPNGFNGWTESSRRIFVDRVWIDVLQMNIKNDGQGVNGRFTEAINFVMGNRIFVTNL